MRPLRYPPLKRFPQPRPGYVHSDTLLQVTLNTLRQLRTDLATTALLEDYTWEDIARSAFADMYRVEQALQHAVDGQPFLVRKHREEIVFLLERGTK